MDRDFDDEDNYTMDATSTRMVCEECGYKWRVDGTAEEVDEEEDTVYYDANEGVENPVCPMCGCSDVIPQ